MANRAQVGDLVAYVEGYSARLHVGIFISDKSSLHFIPLTHATINRIKEKKKPYINYITGRTAKERVVRITEVLTPEELEIYKEIKKV